MQSCTPQLVARQPCCRICRHGDAICCCFLRCLQATPPAPLHRPVQGLGKCHLLQTLLAPNNAIERLPDAAALSSWPLLRHLDLSGNRLAALPPLPPMLHLEALELSDNQISHLDHAFWCGGGGGACGAALPQLQRLDLSFNQIADLACLRRLAALPALRKLQLHDNPAAAQDAHAMAADVALPWLQELDRQGRGEGGAMLRRGGGGFEGGADRVGWFAQGSANRPAAELAARAAACSPRLAVLMARRERASPSLCSAVGSTLQQAPHLLPALMVEARAAAEGGCGEPGGVAPSTDAEWEYGVAVRLAQRQAVEWALLTALKSWVCPVVMTAALRYEMWAAAGIAGAPVPAAPPTGDGSDGSDGGDAMPPWLLQWEAESGSLVDDIGCPEVTEAVRQLRGAAGGPRDSAAHGAGAGGSQAAVAECGGSGTAGAAAADALDPHEQRLLAMSLRHLRELLQPAERQRERLEAHASHARRAADLRSAAERAAAAVSLQAAWRGRAARRHAEAVAQSRVELAAAVLQAAWRGRMLRRSGQLERLRQAAAAEQERRVVATAALQAAARGWLVRRRLRSARDAAAGRHGGGRLAAEAESSGWSLDGVGDDFLQMSADLEAELLALPAASGPAKASVAAPVPAAARPPAREPSIAPPGSAGPGGAALASHSSSGTRDPPDAESSSGSEPDGDGCGSLSSGKDQGSPGTRAAARAARLDARLRVLMAEWGFSDQATALAYYRWGRACGMAWMSAASLTVCVQLCAFEAGLLDG